MNNLPSLQSLMFLFTILPVFPLNHFTFQLSKRENEKISVSQHPTQDNPIELTSQPRSPCRLASNIQMASLNSGTDPGSKINGQGGQFGVKSSCFIQLSVVREQCHMEYSKETQIKGMLMVGLNGIVAMTNTQCVGQVPYLVCMLHPFIFLHDLLTTCLSSLNSTTCQLCGL